MNTTHKTIPVSAQLLGRVIDSRGGPLDSKGPVGDATAVPIVDITLASSSPARANQLFETGIKPIDLLFPLGSGGIHALYADPGGGKQVTVEEVMRSKLARNSRSAMICLGMDEGFYETNELVAAIREGAIDTSAVVVFEQATGSREDATQVAQAGLTIAASLREQGYETLLVADRRVSEEGILSHLDAVQSIAARQTITTILQGPLDNYRRLQADGTLSGLDAYAAFNRALFQRKIYPAIDPLQTASRLLNEGIVGQEHARVAQQVRQLLQRYYALREMVDAQGEAALVNFSAGDQQVLRRGQRVEYFLTQPYVVAEPYTDIPGEYVSVAETVHGFEQLLTGRYDDLPEQAFWMVGNLDQAVEKGKAMAK